MSDPYRQPYTPPPNWPQQPAPPPRRRRSSKGLMAVLLAILSLLLIALGVTAYAVSQNDDPASPGGGATTEATAPGADAGAGTPGAACATNRLGKTFTKDGVVYTCGGPKPYHWLPPG